MKNSHNLVETVHKRDFEIFLVQKLKELEAQNKDNSKEITFLKSLDTNYPYFTSFENRTINLNHYKDENEFKIPNSKKYKKVKEIYCWTEFNKPYGTNLSLFADKDLKEEFLESLYGYVSPKIDFSFLEDNENLTYKEFLQLNSQEEKELE